MRFLARLALAAGIILTLGAFAGHAQTISDAQRGEIEKIIREYLIANPQVLQDVMMELEKRQAAMDSQRQQSAVRENAKASGVKLSVDDLAQIETILNPQA